MLISEIGSRTCDFWGTSICLTSYIAVQSAYDILALYRQRVTRPPLKALGPDSTRKSIVEALYFIMKITRCVQVTLKVEVTTYSSIEYVYIMFILASHRNMGLSLEGQEVFT